MPPPRRRIPRPAGRGAAPPVFSGPMPARLALLAPFLSPSVRGNAVTVERIARGLRARGVELRVWDLSVAPESLVEAEVGAWRPALIHAFHAWRAGPLALRLARRAGPPPGRAPPRAAADPPPRPAGRAGPPAPRLARRAELPLVVTRPGTDANHDLLDPARAAVVRRVLEGAARVTVFHAAIAARVLGVLPDFAGRLVVVPQAARLEAQEAVDFARGVPRPPRAARFRFP